MDDEWATWCRLCGKIEAAKDAVMHLNNDLIQIMKNCFSLELYADVNFPIIVCADCLKFSIRLESFGRQCVKVDQMFTHLVVIRKEGFIQKNLNNIRYEYAIDFNNIEYYENSNDNVETTKGNTFTKLSTEVNAHLEDILDLDNVGNETKLRNNQKRRPGVVKRKTNKKKAREYNSENMPMYTDQSDKESTVEYDERYTESDTESLRNIKEEYLKVETSEDITENNVSPNEIKISAVKKEEKKLTFNCPVCSKLFKKAQLRNMHLKQEHAEIIRPFECKTCPKTFPTAYLLKVHGNTHLPDNEKMIHKCPYCEKCFSKSVNAKAHIQCMHVAERNFICEECGKSFITKGGLKEHCVTHSEERPYQCTTCPKNFKNFQQMKIHEATHSGKPVECKICNKKLNTRKTLREHMVVHSELKKHKCYICGNEYKRRKTLTRHFGTHSAKPSLQY